MAVPLLWQTAQYLIFDCDGVLLPQLQRAAWLREKYPRSVHVMDEFFRGPFQKCLVGEAELSREVGPYLARWGYGGATATFIQDWFALDTAFDTELLQLVHAVRDQGIRVYVASNQEQLRARYLTDTLRMSDYFDGLFFSSHLGFRKPDPEFYLSITERLRCEPGEILFFDDTVASVEAARAFGWRAEVYTDVRKCKADLLRGVDVDNPEMQ